MSNDKSAVVAPIIGAFKGEYGFLSNFHYSTVNLRQELLWKDIDLEEPISVSTVEHGFQAAKASTIEDVLKVANAPGPVEAKYMGRRVQLRENWEWVKRQVMRDLIHQKFIQPVFKERLLDTYPAILIEGNPWGDHYWGMCEGYGHNWLGLILMEVRNELVESL